ncbi:MAG: xanthine dehydrogenase family protein molybdopterin-binding subunit [Planctomycetes bacterium]|nr:xanthine dehydrogenase family protein molybdopterin-binding subunit [Planctomycetota bacterium]
MSGPPFVGRAIPRLDGVEKVTGRARYVDDLVLPGMWFGRTVRSRSPHARLVALRRDPGFDWSGAVFVDASDIPGENVVALIEDDQPALASGEIRHVAEPLALVAAPSPEAADAAARAVEAVEEALPAVFRVEEALDGRVRLHGEDNVFKRIEVKKGDIEAALARAEVVVEGEYASGPQEQLYIEPQGMIAGSRPDGGIVVRGSMQCPYYVHRALTRLFALPDEKVVVVQTVTGGGFGGKEEYPSMIAAHAALLARKAGRPVKVVYDRHEDLVATTKRHPSRTRHRTALTRDGELLGMDIDVTLDGGAYVTLSPVVLSRAVLHAAGAYRCENVRIRGRVVATNHPPHGAFRGFGAPQTLFALELHVTRIARELGIDPIELRRRWALREGDSTATGQVLRWSVAAREVLDAAVERFRSRPSPPPRPPRRRGVGVSLFLHGAGFTGSGEERLKGRAAVEALDGTFRVCAASTEIGQGTATIFSQIAADALGVGLEEVSLEEPDTSLVPDSGPTVASRTCMVVGSVVARAARDLREALLRYAEERALPREDLRAVASARFREQGPLRVEHVYESPAGVRFDEGTYTGDAYPVFGWGCNVAEVDVDPDTGEVEVTRFVAAIDAGKAIHPTLVAGQVEGGAVQGIGWGTIEEITFDRGRLLQDRLATAIIPTSLDVPPIETVLVEKPYPHGPFGAKGIGELPIDGPAPAVASAVADAIGTIVPEIPLTPERVLRALEASRP